MLAPRESPPQAEDRTGSAPSRSYLLVFEAGTSSIHYLPSTGDLLIGRSSAAGLRLTHHSVSRRHARITNDASETRIADVQSHNGTRVNGERVVGSRVLASGDVISLGAVTLVLHREPRPPPRRALQELSAWRGRLEEELERALRYGRPLSLLALELGIEAGRSAVATALDGRLRLFDAICFGGSTQLLVLFPETPPADARVPARRLLASLAAIAPAARGGIASCPEDGCEIDALVAGARAAARVAGAGAVATAAQAALTFPLGRDTVIVADAAMGRVFGLAEQLAAGDGLVLIEGERGAGKHLLAAMLHQASGRRQAPFVEIDCERAGEVLPRHAQGGTVVLHEVAALSGALQAELAEAILRPSARRDVRVIATSSTPVPAAARDGRLREDLLRLFQRATLVIPPLRDRPQEIPIMAHRFLESARARLGRAPLAIEAMAMHALVTHPWPGNVRELQELMDALAAHLPGPSIDATAVESRLARSRDGRAR